MNNDENLDLLDLDDGASMDTLPTVTPFSAPRPKKPWLLLGLGLLVIVLATYIIIKTIGGDSSASLDVDLDAPVVVVDENAPGDVMMPPAGMPTPVAPAQVQPGMPPAPDGQANPAPAPAPQPDYQTPPPPPPAPNVNTTPGVPVRVVEDRKDVSFNPNRASEETPKPSAAPAKKPAAKPAAKSTPKSAARAGSWYVQFGSYSTRALAEAAEKKIRASHANLFSGHQFVILAASPNGNTVYRLRVAFATSNDANGFCRNAKSDGLDCYVTK